MSIFEKTVNRIDSILSDRAKALSDIDEQIRNAGAAVASAAEEMEIAISSGDLAAYQRAKANMTNALDAKEMHEARKEALLHKPLISRTEYEKTVSDIKTAVAEVEEKTKKELCFLSEQMATAADALEEMARSANDVLYRLQHEAYQDADRTRNPKTNAILIIGHEQKTVNPFATINWGRMAAKSAQYAEYTQQTEGQR